MKRFFTIMGSAFLLVAAAGFAETKTLIEFDALSVASAGELHGPTTVDFSGNVIAAGVDQDKLQASLAIEEWQAELVASSRTVENQTLTTVKAAPVASGDYAGQTVLGVRIHYPDVAVNSYAMIKPPFEIPAYELNDAADENDQRVFKFDGYGVVRNVGTIKEIKVETLGRNFPHNLFVVIENETGEERFIKMGNLEFSGWKSLIWQNPNYQEDVRNRQLALSPLYPQNEPFIKIKGILIHRDESKIGGDFVGYIKDIQVIFDQAVLERETIIDDEALWQIRTEEESARRNAELQRLGNRRVLEALEVDKKATEFFDPSTGTVINSANETPADATTTE
jgi:hypothetical protein